jgi:hypothetical protein
MQPKLLDGRYGESTEQVRAAYTRVRAMNPGESFLHPCRDPSVVEGIVARWLATMAALVNEASAERAVARVIGEPGALYLEMLRLKFPPPTFPSSLAIAWAEGPWELLVTPDPPDDPDDPEPWGGMLPGDWLVDETVRRWRDCLLEHHPPLQALVGPPVWQPWARNGLTTLSPLVPEMGISGHSGRARVALAELSSHLEFVAGEFLNFSLVEPILGANPRAWEISMFEHGLLPLGADAESGQLYVYRYNPEPILTPPWLFGMQGR